MKLIVSLVLAAGLFILAWHYCLKGRQVSGRPGAYYLLVLALACEALLLSVVATEGAALMRDRLSAQYAGTGDLLVADGALDPGGAREVATQIPAYPKPSSTNSADWVSWQKGLRSYLTTEVYDLDFSTRSIDSVEIRRQTISEEGRLLRTELSIPAADGAAIPAIMLRPADATKPLPGIVVLPGHVRPGHSGLAQMTLPVRSYHRSAARELARAGFAVVSIELRGFGMLGPPEFPEHRVVAFNAMLAGGFYKKLVFSDIKRTTDYFLSRPDVDGTRIGISGVSLGAELAVEYAALDERIQAIAFHSHGGRTGPYRGISDGLAEQPHYCHVIPDAAAIMHVEDPFLLLAPRPVQGLRGGREPFARPEFGEALRETWAITGGSDALTIDNVPGEGHVYFVDEAIRFFSKYLAADPSPIVGD